MGLLLAAKRRKRRIRIAVIVLFFNLQSALYSRGYQVGNVIKDSFLLPILQFVLVGAHLFDKTITSSMQLVAGCAILTYCEMLLQLSFGTELSAAVNSIKNCLLLW